MIRTEVVGKLKDPRLAVFPVYLPMMLSDTKASAESASEKFALQKTASYWDPSMDLGKQYAKMVKLPRPLDVACDIYFLYGPDAKWEDKPSIPLYWMHQLADDERRLSGDKLLSDVPSVKTAPPSVNGNSFQLSLSELDH